MQLEESGQVEAKTEQDVYRAMAEGKIESPYPFGNAMLFDMRITGTGFVYRQHDKDDEERGIKAGDKYVSLRPESVFTDDAALDRYRSMLVVIDHPDGEPGRVGRDIDSDYVKRNFAGVVVWPYKKGAEAWGIVKIYTEEAALAIASGMDSTSPGLSSRSVQLKNSIGDSVLIENTIESIDHLAIVSRGRWDKGEEKGIRLDLFDSETTQQETVKMADESQQVEAVKADEATMQEVPATKVDESPEVQEKENAVMESLIGAIGVLTEQIKEIKANIPAAPVKVDEPEVIQEVAQEPAVVAAEESITEAEDVSKAVSEAVLADEAEKTESQQPAEKENPTMPTLSPEESQELMQLYDKAVEVSARVGTSALPALPGDTPATFVDRALAFFGPKAATVNAKVNEMIAGAGNLEMKKFALARCYDSLDGHEKDVRHTADMYTTETVYRNGRGESRTCNFISALSAMHQARLKGGN